VKTAIRDRSEKDFIMEQRVHNFSADHATLPLSVAAELLFIMPLP